MECIEKNYGSTLVFCVDATEFDKSDKAMSCAQVKVRMFEAESPNLSNHGHWKCDLTETMQRSTQTVGLELSLQWVRHSGTGSSQESLKSDDFISQIKSIKVRSDSTLSELLVNKVDGKSILKGESIQGNSSTMVLRALQEKPGDGCLIILNTKPNVGTLNTTRSQTGGRENRTVWPIQVQGLSSHARCLANTVP